LAKVNQEELGNDDRNGTVDRTGRSRRRWSAFLMSISSTAAKRLAKLKKGDDGTETMSQSAKNIKIRQEAEDTDEGDLKRGKKKAAPASVRYR
jgi:hypothetical protein